MIKASALFYSIIISLLIAIISSSLILFSYLTTIQYDSIEISQRLRMNVDSGINLLLSKQSIVGINEELKIKLFDELEDSISVSRKQWGAYEVVISKANFKSNSCVKVAQIGFKFNPADRFSLYLQDNDKPLSVCGQTKIKGDAFIPKAGIKRAYIEGQNFIGSTLVDGKIQQSSKVLPPTNPNFFDLISEKYFNSKNDFSDSLLELNLNEYQDTINNSFNNKTIVINFTNSINLTGASLIGNVMVISSRQINVSKNSVVKNAILIAPKIIFEQDFKGCLQAFASDSIILKENIRLDYPSCLGLIKSAPLPSLSSIIISENDSIYGNIFAIKKIIDPLKEVAILLKKKSFVYGQIYSSGSVDAQGVIYGSLMCSKITLTTPSSLYENHLLNSEIDEAKLSKHFIGINLIEQSSYKDIVQWLD